MPIWKTIWYSINTFQFTLRPGVAQKAISEMWRSTFKRLALRQRNCAEITLPSYVNRSTVRYGFRACAKAIRCRVYITSALLDECFSFFFCVTRPAPIVLVKCWKVAFWNVKKSLRRFQKLLPKILHIFYKNVNLKLWFLFFTIIN